MKVVTCIAPVNMAVIKYWGKRNDELILPINDSISCTLSMEHMNAKTTIAVSPDFTESQFWLNGAEQSMDNKRFQNCVNELKRQSKETDMLSWCIRICSENNFPTAAGLASSAAGYACLVKALATIYNVTTDLSSIARQGSGSACRSIHSGWVQWHKGILNSGEDSIATQLYDDLHWPEMRILVLVINDSRKKYSSTSGMKQSVLTSEFLKHRASEIVPQRISDMKDAIHRKDFHKFAEITMQDSNQFHAVCLDTFPPCVYLNDTSHAVINLIHAYNAFRGRNKVAYTFDAGPNACLFLLEEDVEEVLAVVNHCFPTEKPNEDYYRGIEVSEGSFPVGLDAPVMETDCLKYIICTKPGEGAKEIHSGHLLNDQGLPST